MLLFTEFKNASLSSSPARLAIEESRQQLCDETVGTEAALPWPLSSGLRGKHARSISLFLPCSLATLKYSGTLVPDVLSKEGPWARCQEQGGESEEKAVPVPH